MAAFAGKTRGHGDELTSSMAQAEPKDRVGLRTHVARQRIAHLDRWREVRRALAQHRGEILAGVLPAGKIQRHRVVRHLGQHVRGERPLALGLHQCQLVGRGTARPPQIEDPHGRVVMMQQGSVGRLRDQLGKNRLGQLAQRRQQLPLGRFRQRHPQTLLQPGQPVMRQPGAVTQHRERHRHARSVFFLTGRRRRGRGEHRAAGVAAQPRQLVTGGRNRRRALEAQEDRLGLLRAHGAFGAERTTAARLQGGMRDLDPAGAGIVPGLEAAVALAFGLGPLGPRRRGRRAHPVGLLGLRPEEQVPQFSHRHALLFNRRHDLRQHVAHRFDQAIIVRTDPGAHPGEKRDALRFAQQGGLERARRTHGASRRWRKCFPRGYAHSSLIEQVT